MKVELERSGTIAGFADVLQRMAATPGVAALLVFACDDNGHTPDNTDAVLRALPLPVLGGVFPQIIHGTEHLARGTLVVGLSEAPRLTVIRNLSDPALDLDAALAVAVDLEQPESTLFVLVDGFARRISGLIGTLFDHYGLELNYLGGGAGSLSLVQKPCILTNEGLLQDVAIIGQSAVRSGIGVAHGWNTISEPIKVTRADRNTILELNYRPAFEVYKEVVAPHAGADIRPDNFFGIAKAYPFGIRKMGAEVIVRDPLMVGEGGALVCVGEVPEGCFVHILNGNPDSLVAAARAANALAREAYGGAGQFKVFIDCVSRVLFLEDGFSQELAAVADGTPTVGALTLGEIANSGRDYLEFYNKTAVVGLFDPL